MRDCTIIKKLKKNDEKAIEKLIDKYSQYIGAIIYGVSGSSLKAEDIEEIESDVFYALWKRRHNLLETGSLKPYLAQIARNMTKNKFRCVKNEQPLEEGLLISEAEKTDELLIQKEKISIVKEFMATMKYPDKDILTTYYFLNYKLDDIASMYGLPLSTVKSKIYRGRKTINKYFKERGYLYEN